MLFCTPAPGLSHAGILACCTLVDMSDDELHDLLTGHVPVPTKPEPTRLILSDVERARGWLQQAEQRLLALKNAGATREEISKAVEALDRQHLRVSYARAVEALGPLPGGRVLEYDWDDRKRYAVVDAQGVTLFHVDRDTKPVDVLKTLALWDSAFVRGLAAGKAQVRAPILRALGLDEPADD